MAGNAQEPLADIEQRLMRMADLAGQMVGDAVRAVCERNELLADTVIARDDEVDQLDFDIESRCVRLIAAEQPTGRALRSVASVLKVIGDIERIADYSLDIAKTGLLLGHGSGPWPVDLKAMGDLGQEMLRQAMAAFAAGDVEAAGRVVEMDREMDRLYHSQLASLVETMCESPEGVRAGVYLALAMRYLERIGDHISNVAERVLYVAVGQPARLRTDFESDAQP